MDKNLMGMINELKDYRLTSKDVENFIDDIYIKEHDCYMTDWEKIDGCMLDNYIVDIRKFNDDYKYCVFYEKYLNEWSSYILCKLVKDDDELREDFYYLVKEIENTRNFLQDDFMYCYGK